MNNLSRKIASRWPRSGRPWTLERGAGWAALTLGCAGLSGAACAAGGASPAAGASAVSVEVTREGFCLHRIEQRCLEVVLPSSAPIELERLPVLEDGRRGIYFFSDQLAQGRTVVVQVLEALDEDPHVEYGSSPAARAEEATLAGRLKALAQKLAASGSVWLTPFRLERSSAPARVFSSLPIEGPGEFAARVVDLEGTPIPGSERIAMSVMISGTAAPR